MEKEKFIESLRAQLMIVFTAVSAILTILAGAIPAFNDWLMANGLLFDAAKVEPFIYATAVVISVLIYSRGQRNTKIAGNGEVNVTKK